jgi:hypothetical protein
MRWSILPLLAFLAVARTSAADSGQLVVPTLQTSGIDAAVAPVLTELVLEALLTRHGLHALGPADMKDLLNTEQQRQLAGCDQSRCMAELAGALGAAKIVSGVVGRLGDAYVVSLKLVDSENAQVLSRASRRFQKIEEASEVIGPLTDELLRSPPETRVDAPKLISKRKEAEKKRAPVSVDSFCHASLDRYVSALLGGEAEAKLLVERRAVLEDLLLTPFLAELEAKIACWTSRDQETRAKLKDRALASKSEDLFLAADRALGDWTEGTRSLSLLLEAYKLGLDKEQHGTGARPVELPFSVRAPPAAQTAEGDSIARMKSAYDGATATLFELFAAADRGDKARFVAAFDEPGPKGRPAPRDLYVEALAAMERAQVDVCPWYILGAEEQKARAADLERSGRLFGCIRKVAKKGGAVTLDRVELARRDGRLKIVDWRP